MNDLFINWIHLYKKNTSPSHLYFLTNLQMHLGLIFGVLLLNYRGLVRYFENLQKGQFFP